MRAVPSFFVCSVSALVFCCVVACSSDESSGEPAVPDDTGATSGGADMVTPEDSTSSEADSVADDAGNEDTGVECGEPICVVGEPACDGEFGYRVCTVDESGCAVYGPPVLCTPGATCVDGECLGECTVPRVVLVSDMSRNVADRWNWMEVGLRSGLGEASPGASIAAVGLPGRADGEECVSTEALEFGAVTVDDAIAQVTPSANNSGALAIHDGLRRARELLTGGADGAIVVLVLARPEQCSDAAAIEAEVVGLQALGVDLWVLWSGLPGERQFADAIAEPVGATVRLPTNEFAVANALRDAFDEAGICCLDQDGDDYGAFCIPGPDCNEDDDQVHAPLCGGKACGDDGCGGSCGECDPPEWGSAACEFGQCVLTCDEGFHVCGTECVSDDDVLHCGASCSPCPEPAGGVAGCDGTQCLALCNEGQHACDGICVSSSSVDHCGTSCTPCPVVESGQATCDGFACGLACDEGYALCGGACAACPTEGVVSTECTESGQCVATACAAGFTACEQGCCDYVSVVVASAPALSSASSWPSLAVGLGGVAHIAFYRLPAAGGEIVYAVGGLDGFAETVVDSGNYSEFGRYSRMDLDLLDTPRVAYRGGSSAALGEITVQTLTAGVWSAQVLADTFGAYAYGGKDFDLTSDGLEPAVAYPATSQVAISRVDGLSVVDWSVVSVAGEDYGDTPAVAFDSGGIAHVAVVEDGERLKYVTGGMTTWTVSEIEDIDAVGAHRPAIALNGDDAAICFLNNELVGQKGVFVAQKTNGWAVQSIDADANQGCDVAYGEDGSLHVVYRTQGGALKHAWLADGGWDTRTLLDPPAPGLGYRWPSLELEGDALHVSAWNQFDQVVVYLYDPLANLEQ